MLNSSDFLKKIQNLNTYYDEAPKINENYGGVFSDNLDYLTTQDLLILIHDYAEKHKEEHRYDLRNIKLIDNGKEFNELEKLLNDLNLKEPGDNAKIIVKVKKYEPPYWGVHVLPVYLRHEGNQISAFIYDASFGIVYETKDGFGPTTKTLENYLQKCSKEQNINYRIIKASTVTQNDARNCTMYALLALRYYIKYGDKLFPFIEQGLLEQHDKLTDIDNEHIYHLKVDALPLILYKLTNRTTLNRVNDLYNHEWMPVKITLNKKYLQDTVHPDFLTTRYNQTIDSYQPSKAKSLLETIEAHRVLKQSSNGILFHFNSYADKKMNRSRKKIATVIRSIFEAKPEENCTQRLTNYLTQIASKYC